ncbi:MAG: cytidine deaminase [Gemmatimonadaceae bacterium]
MTSAAGRDGGGWPALRAAALATMKHAYAPYSNFRVGAALLADGEALFVGCNVENASYGGGICAERGAAMAAIAGGARHFLRLVVATEAGEPTPPCGLCRQFLVEFGRELEILSITAGGAEVSWTLAELLPHAFTPADLRRRDAATP